VIPYNKTTLALYKNKEYFKYGEVRILEISKCLEVPEHLTNPNVEVGELRLFPSEPCAMYKQLLAYKLRFHAMFGKDQLEKDAAIAQRNLKCPPKQ